MIKIRNVPTYTNPTPKLSSFNDHKIRNYEKNHKNNEKIINEKQEFSLHTDDDFIKLQVM